MIVLIIYGMIAAMWAVGSHLLDNQGDSYLNPSEILASIITGALWPLDLYVKIRGVL